MRRVQRARPPDAILQETDTRAQSSGRPARRCQPDHTGTLFRPVQTCLSRSPQDVRKNSPSLIIFDSPKSAILRLLSWSRSKFSGFKSLSQHNRETCVQGAERGKQASLPEAHGQRGKHRRRGGEANRGFLARRKACESKIAWLVAASLMSKPDTQCRKARSTNTCKTAGVVQNLAYRCTMLWKWQYSTAVTICWNRRCASSVVGLPLDTM